jgi:hypothetical protein
MPTLDARRTTQIIWGAQLGGCLLFLGVAVFLRSTGQVGLEPRPELLGWLGLALPVVLVAASFSVPSLVRPSGGAEAAARTRLVVGWALREGAALAGIVMWLLTGDGKAMGGLASGLAALAATLPTADRWRLAVEAAGGKPGRSPMVR